MVFTTDALVLKSVEVGDNDRLLTLLTSPRKTKKYRQTAGKRKDTATHP